MKMKAHTKAFENCTLGQHVQSLCSSLPRNRKIMGRGKALGDKSYFLSPKKMKDV